MKYHIEELLKNEKIECHEIRATTYDTNHVLLHFFVTTDKSDKYALPQFKLGYERYKATIDDIENNSSKPDEDRIQHYSLVTPNDKHTVLFDQPSTSSIQKNEWTGEQPDFSMVKGTTMTSPSSPNAPSNINTNKNLRYVAEMDDNSIYSTDDALNTDTYLETQDTTLQVHKNDDLESSENSNKNENKTTHSIWKSKIHFDKFTQCNNDELFELFKKYKPYVGLEIPANLDTESHTNIDMESIFGASFDVLRIKNNLFHKDNDDHHMGEAILSN